MTDCDELAAEDQKLKELELDDFECQLYLVAKRTLAILSQLIRTTGLSKLRDEQEAVVIGQLAQSLFAELLERERSDDDDNDQ